MTIGEKIAELRRVNKMTQRDLAEIINVSDKVISKWETGRTLPDVEAILRLSKTFNVSIAELFECIEKTDTNKAEEYNEERIWQYKKYSIIACFLYFLSQIFLWMNAVEWTHYTDIMDTIRFILFFLSIVLAFTSAVIEMIQYVRLKTYAKGKHYQNEYNRILKKYSLIYLGIVSSFILLFVVIFLSFILSIKGIIL